MSKWITSSEISSSMGQKILIAGLQEAGKTAIKRIFFLRQQAVDVNSLKATLDYERMQVRINNVPITVVDLGGQRIFIRRFLSTFSPFIFNSVKIMIFVIDVSIKSTRNNAVQYFVSALEKLKEYSPDCEIYVFLHKNDLIRNSPNYESIHAQIKEQFQVESDKKIKFFRTTIFDEQSVINAFGRIFELTIPQAAKSPLVDGKAIESGEEYSDKFAVEQFKTEEEEICPFCNIKLFKTDSGYECNICGYTPREKQKRIEAESFKPKVTVEDLKKKLTSAKISSYNQPISQEISLNETESQPQVQETTPLYESDLDKNIPQILNLSFNREEVEKKLTLEHKQFLNLCFNYKVPTELLRFMLNEYIVKHTPRSLSVKNQNILQAISYYKFGYIKDNELMKFLYLSEYYKNLSVEDSLWNNFPDPFKESAIKTVDLEKEALDKELLLLSFKENIGAKVAYKEYNSEITFYKGKHKLGVINIPLDITDKELKYMLVFELKFPVESNLQGFVQETTDKLLKEIRSNRQPTKVEEKPIVASKTSNETKVSNVYRLIENKELYYKITIRGEEFQVDFFKEDREFGIIKGPTTLSAPGMFELVKNETLIATLINDDDLMFSVLELYNKFSQLNK